MGVVLQKDETEKTKPVALIQTGFAYYFIV